MLVMINRTCQILQTISPLFPSLITGLITRLQFVPTCPRDGTIAAILVTGVLTPYG
jgi:hypothetical protein